MESGHESDFHDYETEFRLPTDNDGYGSWRAENGRLHVYVDPKGESPEETVHTTVHEIIEADINRSLAEAGCPCHERKSGDKTAKLSITYKTKKYGSYGNLEITTCLCHFLTAASLFEFPEGKKWTDLVDFYLYVGFFSGVEHIKGEM